MKTAFYRMPDDSIVGVVVQDCESMETLSHRPPRLLLMVDGAPSSTPKSCELCIHKDTCWKYEASRMSGRTCDAFQLWD